MTTATSLTSLTSRWPFELETSTRAPLKARTSDLRFEPADEWSLSTTDVSFVTKVAPRLNCTPRLGDDPGQFLFGALDSWLMVVAMIPSPSARPEPMDNLTPSKAIDLLRAWTGLPVTDLADLLGVARRSVYHWSTGAAKPRQEARLLGVVRALEPLSQFWQAWELREWLSTTEARTLVQSAPVPELSRQVEAAVRRGTIGRLHQAPAALHEEVLPLDSAAIERHLLSVVQQRTPRRRPRPYEPRELTDSPQVEDE